MAFDGTVIACITEELNNTILDGRISKVAQPEKDELLLTLKVKGNQYRLRISVNASLPLLYLTEKNIPSPINAPTFCMLLRKHLTGGRILSITQPSLERIIIFEIEHFNEMGDLCRKNLIVEMMGKHSNIILTEDGKIVDSIKHISALVSSVREVLPGRDYFIPFADDKLNPYTAEKAKFMDTIFSENKSIAKALYSNVTGFSPDLAEELLYAAELDSERPATSFTEAEKEQIFLAYSTIVDLLKAGDYHPTIYYKGGIPIFYAPFPYRSYKLEEAKEETSISALLFHYYAERQSYNSIRQKTVDLRQIVSGLLSKDYKKYDLQLKQLKDTEKREKYKVYGELLTAYGYSVEAKATSFTTLNYYTGEEITIPLDPTLSAIDNAKKFFEKYTKMKRTSEALSDIVLQTKAEIDHLESISASLDTVKDLADIAELKKEMAEAGFIKAKYVSAKPSAQGKTSKKNGKTQKEPNMKSSPLHYLSSDGYDIYVGKNNYQNDYISFKLAEGNDWWFHAKNIPGSHVIVKTRGEELPDRTFEEAASLAAHYSKAASTDAAANGKVEIDYVQRKHLRKTPGGPPGFVIYHTNYSMSASTDISFLREI